MSVGIGQHDLLIVLCHNQASWRVEQPVTDLLHPLSLSTRLSAAVVPASASHACELRLGVFTEVAVQLPLPRQIRPACRTGLSGNRDTCYSPGTDDGCHARHKSEGQSFLDHLYPPVMRLDYLS